MAENDGLISVIVPVYNAEQYLEKTIQMVKQQTYQQIELILVDDLSKDGSIRKIRKLMEADPVWASKIVLIEKKQNEGAALARNTGIDAAKGRYIAFLDADDVWMPEKLELELAFLKEKQAAFVCTGYEFGDEQAVGTGKIVHVPPVLTYQKALSRTVIFTSTVLIDTVKTGKELIHMPNVKSEDTALWWKILKNGFNAYGLDRVLAIYRRPAKSLSSNKIEAMKRIWNLYRKQEGLSLLSSAWNFVFWAYRATRRRL